MSVESSVVSSFTSYVTIDECQDKLVEEVVKTWDLTAMEAG